MEVLDKVPSVDRTSLPISQVINIIPRQLFKKEFLRLRNLDVFSIEHRVSHSSIYLPASDMYAYLTGILFYEKSADILSPSDASSSKQSVKGTDGAYSTNLWIPKIITLVSRRPMYSEMKNCLNLLLNRVGLEHDIPLENMVKNLIYETTFLKPEFRFNSDFWTMNHLEYNDCKHIHFHEVFISKGYENIYKLLENMISGIPIILVSPKIMKLISMCEVLKSLMFPFEYHGIVIPYEPKPQLKLILSDEPYLIGMEREVYDEISDILDKQTVLIYDLDQSEFLSPSNPPRIICKLYSPPPLKKKKLSFPVEFKTDNCNKLNLCVSRLEQTNKANTKKYYLEISEIFYQFFIDNILDLKSMGNIEDYVDDEKMIKMRRKKREHKDFMANFCKTETYRTLQTILDPYRKNHCNSDGVDVLEFLRIRKEKGHNNPRKLDEDGKLDIFCDPPKNVDYEDLEYQYNEANVIIPVAKSTDEDSIGMYSYKFFPKLMDKFLHGDVSDINWPTHEVVLENHTAVYDIFHPHKKYTKENVSTIICVISSIATYWYHEHSEKIMHVISLVNYLLKVTKRLDKDQRNIIVKYAIEAMRLFGDYKTIAENISYFTRNIDIQSHKYKIDWRVLNKLYLAYKYLDLGKTYDFEELAIAKTNSGLAEKRNFDESEFIQMTKKDGDEGFSLHTPLEKNRRLGSIVGDENEIKLSSLNQKASNGNYTMIEKKKFLSDNPVYEETMGKRISKQMSGNDSKQPVQSPLNVFEERKKYSSSNFNEENASPCTPFEGCDVEFFEEEDTVETKKRTYELEHSKNEYKYSITPVSKCDSCEFSLNEKDLKNYILEHDDELRLLKAKLGRACPSCQLDSFTINLEIWRECKDEEKKKKEHTVTFGYMGPFSILSELEDLIRNESDEEFKDSESGSNCKFNKLLKECRANNIEKHIMMLDVIFLRKNCEQLFWNLVYRCMLEKKDHSFLLPYEMDLFPELYTEEENYEIKLKPNIQPQTNEAEEDNVKVENTGASRQDLFSPFENLDSQDSRTRHTIRPSDLGGLNKFIEGKNPQPEIEEEKELSQSNESQPKEEEKAVHLPSISEEKDDGKESQEVSSSKDPLEEDKNEVEYEKREPQDKTDEKEERLVYQEKQPVEQEVVQTNVETTLDTVEAAQVVSIAESAQAVATVAAAVEQTQPETSEPKKEEVKNVEAEKSIEIKEEKKVSKQVPFQRAPKPVEETKPDPNRVPVFGDPDFDYAEHVFPPWRGGIYS